MYVTECSIGMQNTSPEAAQEELVRCQNKANGSNAVSQLRTIAGLCNSGEFDAATANLPLHERKINGDATDQAVLRFSESIGSVSELRHLWKKTYELAFNSKNKYMIRTLKLVQREGLDYALPATEAASFQPEDM